MDDAVGGGDKDRPRPEVGVLTAARIVLAPFVIVGRSAVDTDPRSGLDVDDVVGRHGIEFEIILDRGVFEIRIASHHAEEVAVLAVIGVRVEHAEVVPVAVAEEKHRPLRVIVARDVRAPDVLRLESTVATASVLVAFVASGGNSDDLLHHGVGRTAVRVHILHVTRLITPRRGDLGRRPDIVELHPLAAIAGGIRIELIRFVRTDA